jgi:hypothetical protein
MILDAALAANQFDRIDLQRDCRGTALLARLRIEQGRSAETELDRMDIVGMLHQQKTQVGRRAMRGGDGREHRIIRV